MIFEDGMIKEKPACFINMSNDLEKLDAQIIHEFNHLYEMTYKVEENKIDIMCG